MLLRKGWIYEQELARALAHQYELEYVDLETACLNPRDTALLDPEVGQRCRAVPICLAGDELVVAIADPAPDLVEELRARLPYPLRLVVAEPTLSESGTTSSSSSSTSTGTTTTTPSSSSTTTSPTTTRRTTTTHTTTTGHKKKKKKHKKKTGVRGAGLRVTRGRPNLTG